MKVHLAAILLISIVVLCHLGTLGQEKEGARLLSLSEVSSISGASGSIQVPGMKCDDFPFVCQFVFVCPEPKKPCYVCPFLATTQRLCTGGQDEDICRYALGSFLCPVKQVGTCEIFGEIVACTSMEPTQERCNDGRNQCG